MSFTIDDPLERGTSDGVGDNLMQGQTSEITSATGAVPSQVADSVNTSAVPGTSANAKGGEEKTDSDAQIDSDGGSDGEVSGDDDNDPEIAAMKEKLMRYRSRSPGNKPGAGRPNTTTTSQRPASQPGQAKNRPAGVSLGSKTTKGK